MKAFRRLIAFSSRSRIVDTVRRWAVISICLICSMLFVWHRVSAEDLPAKSIKDQQQDDHMHATDMQVVDIRVSLRDIAANEKDIVSQLDEAKRQIGRDEGMATGAFIILGILETLGLITRIRPDSNKPTA